MPFREPYPKEISNIAHVMKELLSTYDQASSAEREYQKVILTLMCRKLEIFIVPYLSKEAVKQAKAMGIQPGALQETRWRDQPTKLRDKGREIFHWEHMTTVSSMVKKIMDLRDSTEAEIEQILRTAELAWITKQEDDALKKRRFSSRRENPHSAYAACKITFDTVVIPVSSPRR